MASRIQDYFIGDFLRKTDDVFEQARAIMLLRFSFFFIGIFALPLASDLVFHYYKAATLHTFDFLILLLFPFVMRKSENLDFTILLFFTVTFFSNFLIFLVLTPEKLDAVGATWSTFFVLFSALLMRGRVRILFTCFLFWLPLIYVIVNTQLGGSLTIEILAEKNVVDAPHGLLTIPLLLGIYAIWTYTTTIEKAKSTITHQKLQIENKNKDILDSINYARRLQEAILPPVELINRALPDNFIYYRPKDIVAGDFYWLEQHNGCIYIAAADCTGHGVPGAMVSVVCSGALTRTIKEFQLRDPGQILDKTRELVIATFEKSSDEVKDGMDISLLCIDRAGGSISWAGANNPLWYVSSEGLQEIKADKQPIGKMETMLPFTTQRLEYKAGTTFYLFTDGLADQFGGPSGKKLKYKTLAKLLAEQPAEPLQLKKEKLDRLFLSWKGELEQIDDICVIGIRV